MDCYGNRCFPMVIMDGLVIHRGGTEPFRVDDMLDPVAVAGVHYELTGRVERDGIHLEWNPRAHEGFVTARVEPKWSLCSQ